MHRIARFNYGSEDIFDEHVTDATKEEMMRLVQEYEDAADEDKAEAYLRILYNAPAGLKLTAHVVTNYGQLKTMYRQRKDHRLPRWRKFCEWIEKLPFAEELGVLCAAEEVI